MRKKRKSTTSFLILATLFLLITDCLAADLVSKEILLPTRDGQEYGLGFDRIPQDDGSVNLMLYSGVRNVPQDKGWVRQEDARDLTPYYHIEHLENDERYKVGLKFINSTDLKLDIQVADKTLEKVAIPITIYNYDEEKAELTPESTDWEDKYTAEAVFFTTFLSTTETKEATLDQLVAYKPGSIVKFGDKSTTLFLKDNNTENMADGYTDSASLEYTYGMTGNQMRILNGTSRYLEMFFKWNITAIPNNMKVTDAQLGYYISGTAMDAGEFVWIGTHRVYQFPAYSVDGLPWNDLYDGSGMMTGTTQPSNSSEYNLTVSTTTYWPYDIGVGYEEIDVSEIAQQSYFAGDDNFTIYLQPINGTAGNYEDIYGYSREYTNFDRVPYLNITYEDACYNCTVDANCTICQYCTGGCCEVQASGDDDKDECDAIECDGDAGTPYYDGFNETFTCLYKDDVSDAEATCNGAGACKSNATECGEESAGDSAGITCNCEAAEIGCEGDEIGSCDNTQCVPTWHTNTTSGTVAGSSVTHTVTFADTENLTLGNSTFNFCDGNYIGGECNLTGEDYEDVEGFESDWGLWEDMEVEWTMNCDFIRDSGGTPSPGTGPTTGAAASTWYLYVETSSGHCYTANDEAAILFEREMTFAGTAGDNVTFYRHQYGANVGDLYLQENTSGSWVTIGSPWTANNNAWVLTEQSLSGVTGTGYLRFLNIAAGGYLGDVAVDIIGIYISEMTDNWEEDPIWNFNATTCTNDTSCTVDTAKTLNSTEGAPIAWYLVGVDQDSNEVTTDVFTYNTTGGGGECSDDEDCDTCEYCDTGECLFQADTDTKDDCAACEWCDGAGGCENADAETDVKNDCSTAECRTGDCDGAGACEAYEDSAKHNCDICEYCSDADGDCDYVPIGQDPLDDCPDGNCDGAGVCEGADCTITSDTVISEDLDCTGEDFFVAGAYKVQLQDGIELWADRIVLWTGAVFENFGGTIRLWGT